MPDLAGWMKRTDWEIVSWFAETGVIAPPQVIFRNIEDRPDVSYDKVKRRTRALTAAGLLEKADVERGYYRLTEDGRRWYDGELDRGDLELRGPD